MLTTTQPSSCSPALTVTVRDPITGEDRQIDGSTLIFHVPADLAPGEPVQVRLDADPEHPAGDLTYPTTAGKYASSPQCAAYRLDSESVAPRGLWLVPEQTQGRETIYCPAIVKPDALGAAGHEVYTDAHRYSAVVRGLSLTLTVARIEGETFVDPITYKGDACVHKGALILELGAQSAVVPDVVLEQLHAGLRRRLGLSAPVVQVPTAKVGGERGYGWLCRHEDAQHNDAPLMADPDNIVLCPKESSRGREWIVLTSEDEVPAMPPGWSCSAWAPTAAPDRPSDYVIWADTDSCIFAAKPIGRSDKGHVAWIYAVVA